MMENFLKVIALSSLITGFCGFVRGMDAEASRPTESSYLGGSEGVWAGEADANSVRHDYPKLHKYLAATTEGADWINTKAEESGNIVCLYYSMRNKSDALDGKCVLGKEKSFEIVFSVMQYLTRVALDFLLVDLIFANPVRTQPDAYQFLRDKTANYFLTEKRRAHIHAGVKLDDVLLSVRNWFEKTLSLRNLHNPIWTLTVGWDDSWMSLLNPWARAIKYGEDDPAMVQAYKHNLMQCFGSKQHPLALRMQIVDKYLALFSEKTLKDVLSVNLTKDLRDQWKKEIYGDLNCGAEDSDIEFEETQEDKEEDLEEVVKRLSIKKIEFKTGLNTDSGFGQQPQTQLASSLSHDEPAHKEPAKQASVSSSKVAENVDQRVATADHQDD